MEQHRVVDFRYIAEDRVIEAFLDAEPTDTWITGIDRAFDDEVIHHPSVAVDGNRITLRVHRADESDSLALLLGYVDAANDLVEARIPVRRLEPKPEPKRYLDAPKRYLDD